MVHRITSICDDAGVDHPTIVAKSGRAMVAQQSVLVFDVLDGMRYDPSSLSKAICSECENLVRGGRMAVAKSRTLLAA